jgi:hypothetical protein
MRTRYLAAAVVVIAGLPTRATADISLAIIEYRLLQPVGQVRLTTGFVHDPETQKAMYTDLASFDRKGIILIAGDSVRHFTRRETIGTHSVETTITVYPAVGHGYRGGLPTADVIVTVDGRKKIDCPYDRGPIELADLDILPLEGMISILGSYDDKQVRGSISLNSSETIDTQWLERRTR